MSVDYRALITIGFKVTAEEIAASNEVVEEETQTEE